MLFLRHIGGKELKAWSLFFFPSSHTDAFHPANQILITNKSHLHVYAHHVFYTFAECKLCAAVIGQLIDHYASDHRSHTKTLDRSRFTSMRICCFTSSVLQLNYILGIFIGEIWWHCALQLKIMNNHIIKNENNNCSPSQLHHMQVFNTCCLQTEWWKMAIKHKPSVRKRVPEGLHYSFNFFGPAPTFPSTFWQNLWPSSVHISI